MEKEKKSNKGLIGLIVVLVIIITALTTIVIMDKLNNNKNKTSNDNTNVTENNNKEDKVSDTKDELKTVNIEDYEDLMSNIVYVHCGYDSDLLAKNYTIDNMPDDYILKVAAENAKTEKYKLEEKYAKILDMDYEYLKDLNEDGYIIGVPSKNIKDSMKKIFNKEINLPKKIRAYYSYNYVADLDAYLTYYVPCGPEMVLKYINYKAEKKGNELYIYSKFYNVAPGAIYDYALFKHDSEGNLGDYPSTAIAKLDENRKINNLEVEEYVKQNLDKFTTYKFTFELKDENYIYSRFEKINNK